MRKFTVQVSTILTVTVKAVDHDAAVERVEAVVQSPDYQAGCNRALEEILNHGEED